MLLHDHAEITQKLGVLRQISELLSNAHLTSHGFAGGTNDAHRGGPSVSAASGAGPGLAQPCTLATSSRYRTTSIGQASATAHGGVIDRGLHEGAGGGGLRASAALPASSTGVTSSVAASGVRGCTRAGSANVATSAVVPFMKRWPTSTESAAAGGGAAGGGGGGAPDAAFAFSEGLHLPRSCGVEVVAALAELGRTLGRTCDELAAAVDDQLVAFYEHMRRKESLELSELCAARRIVPAGFDVYEEAPPLSRARRASDSFSDAGGAGEQSPGVHAAPGGGASPSVQPRPGPALPALARTVAGTQGGGGRAAAALPVDATNSSHVSAAVPLSKHLADSRSAASTLQSFLYLTLESALTACGATCGAVYVNDVGSSGDASPAPVGVAGAPKKAALGHGEPGAPAPALSSTFLQSVARIQTHGYLPDSISYATTNTLTTIVQTGVALNLRNSTFKVGDGEKDPSDHSGAPESASYRAGASRLLNVSNCVAVPIKDFGVVVVANKRSSASDEGDFSATDEHVVWGLAGLCAGVLTRYRRDLLLQFAWNPAGTALLRKFMLISDVQTDPRRRRTRNPRWSADTSTTAFAESDNPFAGTVGGTVLAFIAGREFDKPAARRLAIVRTADERTLGAIPAELLQRRGGGGVERRVGSPGGARGQAYGRQPARGSSTTIRDDELYEGAAQYIANLESLWRQLLSQHNSMQGVVERADRELEARQERIRTLETKVRKLNARVIQLEHSGALGSPRITSGGYTRC